MSKFVPLVHQRTRSLLCCTRRDPLFAVPALWYCGRRHASALALGA
jgi:hypothetical protein